MPLNGSGARSGISAGESSCLFGGEKGLALSEIDLLDTDGCIDAVFPVAAAPAE